MTDHPAPLAPRRRAADLEQENERLRSLLRRARWSLDNWSRADLDRIIDAIDAEIGAPSREASR